MLKLWVCITGFILILATTLQCAINSVKLPSLENEFHLQLHILSWFLRITGKPWKFYPQKMWRGHTVRHATATPTKVHWLVVLLYTSLIQEAMVLYWYLRPVNDASNLPDPRGPLSKTLYIHATDWRCGQVDIVGGVTWSHRSSKIKSFVTTNPRKFYSSKYF